MFKKTLFALGLSVIAATAMAATEGTDYVKLDKPMVNAEGKLTKIFSYDCPFCFKYDVGVDPKVLPRIEKELGLLSIRFIWKPRASTAVLRANSSPCAC